MVMQVVFLRRNHLLARKIEKQNCNLQKSTRIGMLVIGKKYYGWMSRCLLIKSKLPKRLWRLPSERFDANCMVGTVKQDKRIMVWSCFCYDGVGLFHQLKGIMNKHVYHGIL